MSQETLVCISVSLAHFGDMDWYLKNQITYPTIRH